MLYEKRAMYMVHLHRLAHPGRAVPRSGRPTAREVYGRCCWVVPGAGPKVGLANTGPATQERIGTREGAGQRRLSMVEPQCELAARCSW
jgi:hypothetical protein